MSIVIMGMEMPKDGRKHTAVLQFLEDGKCRAIVEYSKSYDDRSVKVFEAVPLPERHGRLIDADAFKAMCLSATKEAKPDFIRHEDWLKSCAVTLSFCRDIDERPTIVPAEGGEEDG